MIKLDLDFKNEIELPSTLEEFKNVLELDDFKYGFKIYGNKLVPLSSSNSKNEGNLTNFKRKNIEDLFNFINNEVNYENFYFIKNGNNFDTYIDKEINEGKISKKVEKELGLFKKVLSKIAGIEVNDLYVREVIKEFLEEIKGNKNKVFDLMVKDKGDKFHIKFNKYVTENGGEPNSEDFKLYSSRKLTLSKEDLTLKVA